MPERLVSKEQLEMALKIISATPKELVEDIYLKNAKLGKLEDIEEVLKKGFYYRCEDEFGNLRKPCFCKPENIWAGRSCFLVQKRTYTRDGHFYDTTDYVSYDAQGKIWALKREELL